MICAQYATSSQDTMGKLLNCALHSSLKFRNTHDLLGIEHSIQEACVPEVSCHFLIYNIGVKIIDQYKRFNLNFYELIFLVAGSAGFLISIFSLTSAGFGWDATFHTFSANEMHKVNLQMSLKQAYETIPYTDEFYGVLVQWSADFLHWLITGDSRLNSEDPLVYYWQGAVNLFLLLVGSICLALTVGEILKRRTLGFGTFCILGITPLWIGTGHTDFKDLPVAVGVSILSCGLSLALSETVKSIAPTTSTKKSRSKKSRSKVSETRTISTNFEPKIIVFISLGIFISIGVRAGSVAIDLVLIMTTLLSGYLLISSTQRSKKSKRLFQLYRQILTGLTIGFLMILTLNPIARINLPRWLFDAVVIANDYPWVGPVRTFGKQLICNDLPWWYIPSWYLVSLPLPLLIAFLGSIGVISLKLLGKEKRGIGRQLLIFAPFLSQAILVPILMVKAGTILYDGIRHVLFILPALSVLQILIFSFLKNEIQSMKTTFVKFAPVALTISLALTIFQISNWVPYEYAFKNQLRNIGQYENNWEMDYWGVSTREGTEKLLNKYGLSEVIILPSGEMASPFGASSITSINGDKIELAGDHKIAEYFGVYLFERYTWSETADLPLNDCKDAPLAKCIGMKPVKCKILFKVVHGGVTLGKGAVCRDPSLEGTADFKPFKPEESIHLNRATGERHTS